MLKYEAFGFCSACFRSNSFNAFMWNSNTDVSFVDIVGKLERT